MLCKKFSCPIPHPLKRSENRQVFVAIAANALAWFVFFPLSQFPTRADEETYSAEQIEFFENRIRPLLISQCLECHGNEKSESGLRLDSRDSLLAGGDSQQPGAIPGDAANSLIVRSVRHESDFEMPPAGTLSQEQIADLSDWVEHGMAWPIDATNIASRSMNELLIEHREKHWAFQPVRATAVDNGNATGPSVVIDQIVSAKLKSNGLELSELADKRTLIRRATFDLIGLPPTLEQVDSFVNDTDPAAYSRLLDRLLASPQYGERWARHWLDVARYSDTSGYRLEMADRSYPYAFTYRDYVIDAFNLDLPYDQFVREQLAADYLEIPDDRHTLAALGFITVGRKFLGRPDTVDDQVDVVTRGLMGLSVSCARCHDHKYDAIPTEDYYSLYSVFENCREPGSLPVLGDAATRTEMNAFLEELKNRRQALSEFENSFQDELKKGFNTKLPDVLDEAEKEVWERLKAAIQQQTAATPETLRRAMGLEEKDPLVNERVMIRGNINQRGAEVPRRFLALLSPAPRRTFENGAGRLELAEAIVSPENPLTARVLVNRIWMHHFSRPLVDTPSDFGIRCEPPIQKELLDNLAIDLMTHGWSIKHLHRTIMMSHVFQQSSVDHERGSKIDPENRLLWKMNRRRLEFEALRDSILAVSGTLDLALHGKAVDLFSEQGSNRRTIYGRIDRQDLPNILRAFDIASPDQSAAQRTRTVVPQQSLFLLNNPFMIRQSGFLAKTVLDSSGEENAAENLTTDSPEFVRLSIIQLYETVFQRKPIESEIEMAANFLRAATINSDSITESESNQMGPWGQLSQALMCSIEFEFVD